MHVPLHFLKWRQLLVFWPLIPCPCRWGIYEAICPLGVEGLVRQWSHEALKLFSNDTNEELYKWFTHLNKVDSLRQELRALENEASRMQELITTLEASINRYKEKYAGLILQADAIKTTLKKINRSMGLMKSLGIEKNRWGLTGDNFKLQMTTLIGDVFLSSTFLSYGGYFDQQHRNSLFTTWDHHLEAASNAFKANLARTVSLSDPDERLNWQNKSLPSDDLCTENAIMLKMFNRYPLIIDPSGQATEFIINKYRDRKITKTSFLDNSFRKNLESVLRFTNPMLVQDVETYDSILNPVLNREPWKTRGRVLIFLNTRDPKATFPPDIDQVLKAEPSDNDQKRSDLLKLQGEFQLRLEKNLLTRIKEANYRILNDDNVVNSPVTLMTEAAEVGRKVINAYDSKLLLIRAGIEVNPGPKFEMKKIQDVAVKIWKHAGEVVDIPAEQNYTFEGNTELDPSVTTQLVNILKEDLGVSFQLKEYQNVTIQAMAKSKDVIVISPPGSGKSLATYAGASLLRKLHDKPAGVVLHLVPYNSIILDKVKNPWLPTGFIMMGGKTGKEEGGNEEGDVQSNFTLQDLEEGKLSVLVCHPESLLSKQGEEILKCLLRSNLLLAVMVDEFHKVLFWGCSEAELTGRQKDEFSVAFRPGMKKVVRKLKSLASKVPFVFETATIMTSEIDLAKKTFSIKSPVIVTASPIQKQHCYFNLRRPDQGVPWEGDEDDEGNPIPGLKDVLMELLLKPYIKMIKTKESGSQKIMLFSRNRATLDKIDQELCVLLPEQSRLLPDQSPW